MRCLLKAEFCTDTANTAIRDGSLGKTIRSILDDEYNEDGHGFVLLHYNSINVHVKRRSKLSVSASINSQGTLGTEGTNIATTPCRMSHCKELNLSN